MGRSYDSYQATTDSVDPIRRDPDDEEEGDHHNNRDINNLTPKYGQRLKHQESW